MDEYRLTSTTTNNTVAGESFIQTDNAYQLFVSSIRNSHSRDIYEKALKYFMDFLGVTEYYKLLDKQPVLIEGDILSYIEYLRDTRKVAPATLGTYVGAIKRFYDENEIESIKWNKINKRKGDYFRVVEDRPYTREEIKQLLDKAEQRNKAIILLLCSSGIRVGAFEGLKLGHLKPIDKYNIYQIEIYKRYKEKYITFCSAECRKEIDTYLGYRERCGEILTPESPLFRKTFDRVDLDHIRHPKPVTRDTIRWAVKGLLNTTGVRPSPKMLEGQTHNERTGLMELHGFRKFFDTTCTFEAGMSTLYSEILMGHDIGLKGRYTKPTPEQLLEGNDHNPGYIDAMEYLTINEENRLRRKVQQLTVRTDKLEALQNEFQELKEKLGL